MASATSSPTTLAELVSGVASRDGEKAAIIFQDRPISYAWLDAQIERAADGLAALGVGPGERVALMLPNVPEFVVAYYAVLRLGAIVVPLNVMYRAEEVAQILSDSEAAALIVHDLFLPQVAAALPAFPSLIAVVVPGAELASGARAWSALIDGSAPRRPPAQVTPDDVAVICYTSGTTGHPKGAMLSHRNLLANCEQMSRIPRMPLHPDGVILLVLPLFHIYGMNVGMNLPFLHGATMVLVPRFEPLPVLEQLQRYRCTNFLGAPPIYVAWVNTPQLADFDLSHLIAAGSGAAALPVEVLRRFEAVTGVPIMEGYGLTETSPTTHSNAAGPVNKPGTVGPPIPGVEARVVDDEGRELPPGAEGEIVIRGDNVMLGYWRNPEATAEALRDGWFHTGDIGTVDDDGYFAIVDRKKDMINAGGFKIWPREVEEALFAHPAVREVAVVPLPDAYAGERPIAYVVPNGAQPVAAEELIAHCRRHLASFKVPVRVEFRDELPKLPTGKVLRRALKEDAARLAERE